MKTRGTHVCGCSGRHWADEHTMSAEQYFNQPCPRCIAKGLWENRTVLEGTERQVAWAESIRENAFQQVSELTCQYDQEIALRTAIASQPSAEWWIDNRDMARWLPARKKR